MIEAETRLRERDWSEPVSAGAVKDIDAVLGELASVRESFGIVAGSYTIVCKERDALRAEMERAKARIKQAHNVLVTVKDQHTQRKDSLVQTAIKILFSPYEFIVPRASLPNVLFRQEYLCEMVNADDEGRNDQARQWEEQTKAPSEKRAFSIVPSRYRLSRKAYGDDLDAATYVLEPWRTHNPEENDIQRSKDEEA